MEYSRLLQKHLHFSLSVYISFSSSLPLTDLFAHLSSTSVISLHSVFTKFPKMSFYASRHPTTKWAQTSDKVFITIELPDAKDVKLALQPDGHFNFSATGGPVNIPYEINFELYDKVNVEESKTAIGLRNICYLVKKAEKKWWSRLLKQEGKPPVYLKVDWDRWVDEDDEDENKFGDKDFGDMDFSKLGMDGEDEDFDYDEKDGENDGVEDSKMEEDEEGNADEAEGAGASNGSEVKAEGAGASNGSEVKA